MVIERFAVFLVALDPAQGAETPANIEVGSGAALPSAAFAALPLPHLVF